MGPRGRAPKGQKLCKFQTSSPNPEVHETIILMSSYIVCIDTKFLSEECKLSMTVRGVAQLGPWEGNGGGGEHRKKYLFRLFLQNPWSNFNQMLDKSSLAVGNAR